MKMRYSDTIRALSALLFLSVTLTGCAGKTGENSSTPQPSKEIDVTTYYEKHSTVASNERRYRFDIGARLLGRRVSPSARSALGVCRRHTAPPSPGPGASTPGRTRPSAWGMS